MVLHLTIQHCNDLICTAHGESATFFQIQDLDLHAACCFYWLCTKTPHQMPNTVAGVAKLKVHKKYASKFPPITCMLQSIWLCT